MNATDYNRDWYDRAWANISDYIRFHPGARHRRRQIFAYLSALSFRDVVDVGCGNAELLRLVDERYPGKALFGLDLSSEVVASNQRALPHMTFFAHNVLSAQFHRTFDVVLCSEVVEHVDHPAEFIREIGKLVTPGGHLVLTCPTGKVYETERHFGHVRHPTPAQMQGWLADAGLVVRDMRQWGFPVYALTKWATNVRADLALKHFGETRYGLAQRAVAGALYAANFFNADNTPGGVQLYALAQRPSLPASASG